MAMTALTDTTYTLTGTTTLSFADAVARARETLKEEGFGVLTEIDVQATLKEKLDLDGGSSAHALARGFGPGILGLRWGW